ncbi:hypothetical protein C0995_015653 [Termitomyces sp. Mi166|nr:hypothetical protein C0995_015653 [Termitomyces sp. Mi166\
MLWLYSRSRGVRRLKHLFNKKLTAKKANRAKAEAALQHWAINNFSGRIPNGLGVKVWEPLNVEQLNLCFRGALRDCMYYSAHSNAIFVRANANRAAAFEYSAHQQAKMLALVKLNKSLLDQTMQVIVSDPIYRDLQSPIQGNEDMDIVVPRHVPTRFMCVKEDGTIALHVMHAPDPAQPFDLKQIAQYALIYGWAGLENTWQGIAFDFAYHMHWRTLFGFTLCQALCTTSAARPAVMRRLALVTARPGMYWEAVASYNAAFPDQPMVAQYRSHLNLLQVHVPDEMARNFLDDNTLRVLLHNQILLDWVDHAYTYGIVYLEQ